MMKFNLERRILATALVVLFFDQATKWLVVSRLPLGAEIDVVEGFFKWVHWGNTGAAWSTFHGNNAALAAVSAVALVLLYLARRYFEGDTAWGQFALGLVFGGILGNLLDRLIHQHVVDFLRFQLIRRDGEVFGFPAFNVADSAICTGVGIIFLLSWVGRPGVAEGVRRAEMKAGPVAGAPRATVETPTE